MPKVELTPDEMQIAINVAELRFLEQRNAGRPLTHFLPSEKPADVIGAMGELAVSKYFNFEWDGAFFKDKEWLEWRDIGSDVGPFEVRTTIHKTGRLCIQKKDREDKPFILVRAHEKPAFQLVGWCFADYGKQEKWWKDVGYGYPCFYVPETHLRPISELVTLIENAF